MMLKKDSKFQIKLFQAHQLEWTARHYSVKKTLEHL